MKETFLYLIAALGFLFLLGYSIHMLVNGLVSERTEWILILLAEAGGVATLVIMARNIIRARRSR